MTDLASKLLRFEGFELDLASRELYRAGETVALEPRVYDLLAYLYEQRHRAVNKDDIQDVVWKGIIVSETALTRAIMKARRAAGDSAGRQAVIRTVHGHGYQFVAVPAEAEQPAVESEQVSRFTSPRLLAGLMALAVIIFVVALWPDSGPQQAVRLAIMPVQNATDDPEYDWTRLGLMGFANDLVTRGAEISILAPSDVMRFAERNAQYDDINDARLSEDFEDLVHNYGASHMLLSTLARNTGVFRLTYALHSPDGDIKRGTMVGAEPTELMRGMIRSINGTLGDQVPELDQITVVSEDPFINEAYSRGLSYSLEGRCADALQLFEVVMAGADEVGRSHLQWASCARVLGMWQEAEAGFKEILDETPVEPATTLRALAFNGLGTVYLRTGRRDAGYDTFQLGLSEAVAADDYELQGKLLNSLAIDAKNRREYDEARELLARATLAYTESGSGVLPGQLPAALANIDMAEGKLDQADKHLQQALAAFRAQGDRRNEAMMLNNTGYLRGLQNLPHEAEPLHLQSLEIRREIGDTVGQGRILGMLSTIYESDGRLDEAREAATEAYRIANEANDKLFMATGLAQLASVEQTAGNLDEARRLYVESKEIFELIEDYSRAAQVAIRFAYLDRDAGDYAAAYNSAQEVLEIALREALDEPAIEAMELSGDIASLQLDSELAIASYRSALSHIEATGFISRRTGVVIKLANTLLDEKDLEATEALLGYMIEQGNTADSLKLRARYAYVQGDVERSISLQEQAQSMAEDDWSETDAEALAEYRAALVE
jgi:DNA-binding winged helix-turn-helix (wHTH) protein/tetratricopeptide (TPR) repeat protein